MEGTVKWFNRTKGFGFIQGDDGNDYFVHHTVISPGVFLRENDRVTFDPADTDKGKQAQNVNLMQGESTPPETSEETTEESDESTESEEKPETSEETTEESDESTESEEKPETSEETTEEPKVCSNCGGTIEPGHTCP